MDEEFLLHMETIDTARIKDYPFSGGNALGQPVILYTWKDIPVVEIALLNGQA